MPFLGPIVYPTKRNKDDVKQTIYIGNILGSCQEKQNGKKEKNETKNPHLLKNSSKESHKRKQRGEIYELF